MTLNDVDDLIEKIGYPDDSTDQGELKRVIEEAHQQMKAQVGRNFVETFRIKKQLPSGDIVNEIDLQFAPIYELDEILIYRHQVVDESNYTVDLQNGRITIDQSFVDEELSLGETLRIKYKPQIFKQIELWRAVEIIKNQEIVELEDTEQVALNRNALLEAKRLENMVNRRAGPGKARDGDIRRGTK